MFSLRKISKGIVCVAINNIGTLIESYCMFACRKKRQKN